MSPPRSEASLEKFRKVPRISKKLPDRRADYSFGDLIFWHFFVYGTRPNGDPCAKVGRVWSLSEFRLSQHVSERTLNNWISERHLPDSTVKAEKMLFGNKPAWDDARFELAEALRRTRALKKTRKSRLARWFTGEPAEQPVIVRFPPPGGDAVDTDSGKVRKSAAESDPGEPENLSTGIVPYGEHADERKSSEKDEAESTSGKLPSPLPAGQLQKPSAEDVPARPKRQGRALPAILFPEWLWGRRDPRDEQSWREQARDEFPRWEEQPEESPRSGGLDPGRPSGPRPGHPVRKFAALAVTAAAVLLGMYAWSIRPIQPKRPTVGPTAGTPTAPTVPPKPEIKQQQAAVPPSQTPAAPPRTEEQKRAEEERRIMEKTVAAMKAAHGTEVREREKEARRLDQEGAAGATKRAQRDREWNARQVAGMGYRLLEYTGVTGTSIGQVQTETVYDCALSCLADKCDAFAWFRDERPSGPRTCYRYRAPVNFYNNPGYTSGKKSSQLLLGRKLTMAGDTALTVTHLAQAASPPDHDADDVTHCPNGPVKVTGFKLTCDAMLVGGTTLGSHRLSWTVKNINECARKCQPIKNCVGFTYNAAQQGGHSCVLFGPTPEKREDVPGWISGERPQR